MLNKWLMLGGAVLTSLVCGSVENASAHWQCPVGVEPGGPNNSGIACVWIEEPQPPPRANPDSRSGKDRPSEPTFRPSQVPIHELTLPEAVARIATSPTHKAQFEALYGKILFNEPQQGLWVMKSKDGDAKQCSATFFERPNLTNGLTLMGPSEAGAGAMLFQGNKLPRTTEMKEIQPVLTFNGRQAGTVRAALLPSGVLVLGDTVALIRAAQGSGEIALQLDGKEIFRIQVHGLTEVRSAILECMGAT